MHLNSQLLFERYALPYFDTGQRVLEIGPDAKPSTYQRLAEYADTDWVTVDLDYGPTGEAGRRYSADGSTVDHFASNRYVLPFPSDQFDVVVSGQVLEHVPKIWTWFVGGCANPAASWCACVRSVGHTTKPRLTVGECSQRE